MSTKLIELDNRIVTDSGDVVAKYDLLVQKALSGEVFTDLTVMDHPDVQMYSHRSGNKLKIWEDDGGIQGPPDDSYEWSIPDEYKTLDIEELCVSQLVDMEMGPDLFAKYDDRLVDELTIMREQDMFPFIRCLLYVVTVFHENGVVWGVGRGSSCASLVLFLLGINKVDPVKYEIPMEEFYK